MLNRRGNKILYWLEQRPVFCQVGQKQPYLGQNQGFLSMSGVSLYDRVLGDATDERLRGWAINAAIAGFLLHVVACTLHRFSSLMSPR